MFVPFNSNSPMSPVEIWRNFLSIHFHFISEMLSLNGERPSSLLREKLKAFAVDRSAIDRSAVDSIHGFIW